jgi:hypothetical protein
MTAPHGAICLQIVEKRTRRETILVRLSNSSQELVGAGVETHRKRVS